MQKYVLNLYVLYVNSRAALGLKLTFPSSKLICVISELSLVFKVFGVLEVVLNFYVVYLNRSRNGSRYNRALVLNFYALYLNGVKGHKISDNLYSSKPLCILSKPRVLLLCGRGQTHVLNFYV